jgi:hypothetical protein
MKDFSSNLLVVQSLVPILAHTTADGTGLGVDLAGFDGALMIAHVGQSGDTLAVGLKWTVQFQENSVDTAGTYSDIADADLEGGTNGVVIDAAAEDEIVVARGYKGSKRWLRVLFTQTGTHTNGTPLSAVIIKGRPFHAPAA